jgi:uncharacterized membrane protein
MKTRLNKEILDSMSKNPANWKGIFYFNRKDPRIIVPKYYPSTGWTLNFANPFSYLALLAILMFIKVITLLVRK